MIFYIFVSLTVASFLAGTFLSISRSRAGYSFGEMLAAYILIPIGVLGLYTLFAFVGENSSPNVYPVAVKTSLVSIPGTSGKYLTTTYQHGVRHVSFIKDLNGYAVFTSLENPRIFENSDKAYVSYIEPYAYHPLVLPWIVGATDSTPSYYNIHVPHGTLLDGYTVRDVTG